MSEDGTLDAEAAKAAAEDELGARHGGEAETCVEGRGGKWTLWVGGKGWRLAGVEAATAALGARPAAVRALDGGVGADGSEKG